MTDAKLIENFQEGDINAFNTLVERWQQRIHRLSYRYFSSHDEAMEITQKTFIKVYKNIDTLENKQKFGSWIYRITKNLCLDESKRAARKRSSSLASLNQHPVTNSLEDDPQRLLRNNNLEAVLLMALKRLPYEQRIVVIMKEYEGLKFREIANILDEPESTVKSRMYYGLTKLRTTFNQWNINMEAL